MFDNLKIIKDLHPKHVVSMDRMYSATNHHRVTIVARARHKCGEHGSQMWREFITYGKKALPLSVSTG